jgi:hypothetical protein
VATTKDIPIEQLDSFEERLGVSLSRVSVNLVSTWLRVCGQITPKAGHTISTDVRIQVDALNSQGKVVQTGNHVIYQRSLYMFRTFQVILNYENAEPPARVRIYPKPH